MGVVNGGVAMEDLERGSYRPYSKGALDLALLFSFLYVKCLGFRKVNDIGKHHSSITAVGNLSFLMLQAILLMLIQYYLGLFLSFFLWPCGMWDLSPPTWEQTRALCLGSAEY